MEVPNEADWQAVNHESLDEAWAYKTFRGKTFDEAVRLFEENAIGYQENLMYMPAPVFGFYLRAYMAYLMSDAARGDSDGASCFVGLIRFKSEHDREILIPNWPEIEPVLKHLVEHQDDYEAIWEIYGSFRAKAREIADRGFPMTFDTDSPEVVPESVAIGDVAYPCRTTSWPVALQLFHHTNINQVQADSKKPDILRIFGEPDASGGGDHPRFGFIPDWILYHKSFFTLRFEFDGESIASVTFMPPRGSSGIRPEVEKFLSPETRERMAWLHAPLEGPGGLLPEIRARLDAHKRFNKLWPDGE